MIIMIPYIKYCSDNNWWLYHGIYMEFQGTEKYHDFTMEQ